MRIINGINNQIPDEWRDRIEDTERKYPVKKDKKDLRYIGKYAPRVDARDIVTGKAVYLDDFSLPGMLYGKALRSPYANAIIKSIDTSRAKTINGVQAVLCCEDFPDKSFLFGVPPVKAMFDRHLRCPGCYNRGDRS